MIRNNTEIDEIAIKRPRNLFKNHVNCVYAIRVHLRAGSFSNKTSKSDLAVW